MTVRLIAVSKPVIPELETPGQLLAYCARVSSAANQSNHLTGPKLLARLIRKKEWSPLEMVTATMEITTTRDIARQILRHRSFSFQEFSQRYAKVEESFVPREARMQHPQDRQSSLPPDDADLEAWWSAVQDRVDDLARTSYDTAISKGIAKEVARAILPEGMTPSRLYMQGSIRSWVHYTGLRQMPETQEEHRLIAAACADALKPHFPELAEAFDAPAIPAPVSK